MIGRMLISSRSATSSTSGMSLRQLSAAGTECALRAERAQCATRVGNIALEARISRSEVGCGELTRPTPNGVQVHENESGRRGVVTALDGSDLSSRPPPASRPTRRVRRKNAEGQLTPSINETASDVRLSEAQRPSTWSTFFRASTSP